MEPHRSLFIRAKVEFGLTSLIIHYVGLREDFVQKVKRDADIFVK